MFRNEETESFVLAEGTTAQQQEEKNARTMLTSLHVLVCYEFVQTHTPPSLVCSATWRVCGPALSQWRLDWLCLPLYASCSNLSSFLQGTSSFLQGGAAAQQQAKGGWGLGLSLHHLIDSILGNLQLVLTNVHIRWVEQELGVCRS